MKIYLILILALASILRLFALSSFPAGFNADEAALGYNAYSILQTGKDEYGASFPLVLKSFGDYKPGLYVYFAIPFVAALGLNELAVRLPSALLGIASVYLIYLLGKKIFNNEFSGLMSALLLAISPWHLHFSRGAWETNVATFFITLGVYLFILGLDKPKLYLFSLISFLVSMYTYQSPRLVVPVLLLFLTAIYFKKLIKFKKQISLYLLIAFILSIPLIFQFVGGTGSARFSGLSFLSDSGPTTRVNELRGEHSDPNSIFAILVHNKITAYVPIFLGHYLDHFSGNFLFINGDPLIRNKVPETGQFYLICILFLVVGFISLIRNKYSHIKLLIAWILVAPLASSLTYQTPHALRALSMVIPLTLIMGNGLELVVRWMKKFRFKYLLIGFLVLIISFEFVHYLESYYIHYPKRYPEAFEYGFSRMVPKLENLQGNFQKVVITDKYDQPYILVLFFERYNPSKYQPQAHLSERDKFNFGTIRNFDKYEFREIKPDEVGKNPGVLYVGTETEIPKNANIIDEVDFPNGKSTFYFAKGG